MMRNWFGGVVLSTSLAASFLFTTGCNKSSQKELIVGAVEARGVEPYPGKSRNLLMVLGFSN